MFYLRESDAIIDFCFSISDLPFPVMTNGRHVPHRYNCIADYCCNTVCCFQKIRGGETKTRNKHRLPESSEALLDRVLFGMFC